MGARLAITAADYGPLIGRSPSSPQRINRPKMATPFQDVLGVQLSSALFCVNHRSIDLRLFAFDGIFFFFSSPASSPFRGEFPSCFIGFYRVYLGFTEVYWVLPRFHRVLLGFTEFYWTLPSFTGFYQVLQGFTGLYLVLLGFKGFYWVLQGFIGFYLVLLGFT